jgi:hypothetical protein
VNGQINPAKKDNNINSMNNKQESTERINSEIAQQKGKIFQVQ